MTGRFHKTFPSKWGFVASVFSYLLIMGGVVYIIALGESRLGYEWKWYLMPQYFFSHEYGEWVSGPFINGIKVTLQIIVVSLVFTLIFGLLAALLSKTKHCSLQWLSRAYTELMRNTPLLIQIFFMSYVVAPVIGADRFWSAVLALSLFEGAYAAEIFRAGLGAVQKGQWEAAYSLGLSSFHTYTKIILPQAVRYMLPPLTGVGVSLIKDSSLASIIAVYELSQEAKTVASDSFMPFEVWFIVAAIYLSLTLPLSLIARFLEKRLQIKQ